MKNQKLNKRNKLMKKHHKLMNQIINNKHNYFQMTNINLIFIKYWQKKMMQKQILNQIDYNMNL